MYHKNRGDLGIGSAFLTLAMIIMLYVFILFVLQGKELQLIKNAFSNGIKLTNLASGVVDEELLRQEESNHLIYDPISGFQYETVNKENITIMLLPDKTYENFKKLVAVNVFSQMTGNKRIIHPKVLRMTIYNVNGMDVIETTYRNGTDTWEQTVYRNGLGKVTAPNGIIIQRTSIYSEVVFDYQDMFGRFYENLKVDNLSAVRIAG